MGDIPYQDHFYVADHLDLIEAGEYWENLAIELRLEGMREHGLRFAEREINARIKKTWINRVHCVLTELDEANRLREIEVQARDAQWEKRKVAERERDAAHAEIDRIRAARNCILNYWFPLLGYQTANEMCYPALEDSRATQAPLLAEFDRVTTAHSRAVAGMTEARAEVERLRGALGDMVNLWDDNHADDLCCCLGASDDCPTPPPCELCVARAALAPSNAVGKSATPDQNGGLL